MYSYERIAAPLSPLILSGNESDTEDKPGDYYWRCWVQQCQEDTWISFKDQFDKDCKVVVSSLKISIFATSCVRSEAPIIDNSTFQHWQISPTHSQNFERSFFHYTVYRTEEQCKSRIYLYIYSLTPFMVIPMLHLDWTPSGLGWIPSTPKKLNFRRINSKFTRHPMCE